MWPPGLLELGARLADGGQSGKCLKGRRLPSGGFCCSVTQSLKAGVHHKPPGALKFTAPYTFKEQLLQESSGPLPEGIQEGMSVARATAPTTAASLVISRLHYPCHIPLKPQRPCSGSLGGMIQTLRVPEPLVTMPFSSQGYLCCCYYCCCSIAQSGLTPCDSMDCSTPGFPVHHQLLELAQTHVY